MSAHPNGLGVWVRQGVQEEVLQGRELEVQQRDRREGARVQMSSDQPAGQETVLVLLQDVGDDFAADVDIQLEAGEPSEQLPDRMRVQEAGVQDGRPGRSTAST